MGQRLVIVPLPWSDVSQSLHSGCGRFGAVSVWELAFLTPLDLSDPVAPSLEETSEVPMRVESSSSLHGLSSD